MISLFHYFVLSAFLFSLGLGGLLIHRKNLIRWLICIELLLLAVNTQFIAISYYCSRLLGQIIVFFTLTVAASETAVALAILMLLFREHGKIDLSDLETPPL